MRFLGGMMIVGGCLGLGLWYREQFVGRIQSLRTLISIIEMLMSEIRYGKATLPECCLHLSKRLGQPYSEALMDIYEEMDKDVGASFQETFCRRMENCMKELPLKEGDREIFLQPFHGQGFQDGAMQLKSLEQVLSQLSDRLEGQERERHEKCRMAIGLGAMSGLLILIVLL